MFYQNQIFQILSLIDFKVLLLGQTSICILRLVRVHSKITLYDGLEKNWTRNGKHRWCISHEWRIVITSFPSYLSILSPLITTLFSSYFSMLSLNPFHVSIFIASEYVKSSVSWAFLIFYNFCFIICFF